MAGGGGPGALGQGSSGQLLVVAPWSRVAGGGWSDEAHGRRRKALAAWRHDERARTVGTRQGSGGPWRHRKDDGEELLEVAGSGEGRGRKVPGLRSSAAGRRDAARRSGVRSRAREAAGGVKQRRLEDGWVDRAGRVMVGRGWINGIGWCVKTSRGWIPRERGRWRRQEDGWDSFLEIRVRSDYIGRGLGTD